MPAIAAVAATQLRLADSGRLDPGDSYGPS
jgi:hypothetical protein